MSADPFIIDGPTLWSFSGGRTSAYMLWRALQAYGGKLPDDHVVAFANTGKEREETLRFVYECGSRWRVQVRWVEWVHDGTAKGTWREVGFNSASRSGEPFDALIDHKQRLPNGRERWCTQYLKVFPIHNLARSLGMGEPGNYAEPIGIRADEMDRVFDGKSATDKDKRDRRYPLARVGVSNRDVLAFWFGADRRFENSEMPQGFDLGLSALWGNCNLCFQARRAKRIEQIRQEPSFAAWWDAAEKRTGGRFSDRDSIADLTAEARAHKANRELFDDADDAECGLWCPGQET
jgi:hypothetical protein